MNLLDTIVKLHNTDPNIIAFDIDGSFCRWPEFKYTTSGEESVKLSDGTYLEGILLETDDGWQTLYDIDDLRDAEPDDMEAWKMPDQNLLTVCLVQNVPAGE